MGNSFSINRNSRMYTDPFRDIKEHCKKCQAMKNAVEHKTSGILTFQELGALREKCATCKNWRGGIYKADAILSSFETQKEIDKLKSNRNVGKKPTREKQFGTAVKNLRNEGKTIREIAETLGISPTTVQKIVKNQEAT